MKITMKHYNPGSDYGEVYRLFTDYKVNSCIINKPDHNSMSVFSDWLNDKLKHEFNDFMIFRAENDDFIGFAYSYDFQPLNGHCLFTIAVKKNFENSSAGFLIAFNFLDYLFKYYNLRKVYLHIYESNKLSIQCLKENFFQKEGVLEEYRYFNNRYESLLIYSIKKQNFDNLKLFFS